MEEYLGNCAIVLTGMKRDTEKQFLLRLCRAREQSHQWPGWGPNSFREHLFREGFRED